MLLAKTDKARAAIQGRDQGLSAQERHILIVSNGRRSLDDIVSMLGAGALAPIDRLLREGFLEPATGEPPAAVASALPGRAAQPSAPSPSALPASPLPSMPAPRRSLAAAKMYMLDMLQLQRSVEAASLKVAIQSANGSDDVLDRLVESLHYLRAVASGSYYTRVATRLAEVLPEQLVPSLRAALRVDEARSTAA